MAGRRDVEAFTEETGWEKGSRAAREGAVHTQAGGLGGWVFGLVGGAGEKGCRFAGRGGGWRAGGVRAGGKDGRGSRSKTRGHGSGHGFEDVRRVCEFVHFFHPVIRRHALCSVWDSYSHPRKRLEEDAVAGSFAGVFGVGHPASGAAAQCRERGFAREVGDQRREVGGSGRGGRGVVWWWGFGESEGEVGVAGCGGDAGAGGGG